MISLQTFHWRRIFKAVLIILALTPIPDGSVVSADNEKRMEHELRDAKTEIQDLKTKLLASEEKIMGLLAEIEQKNSERAGLSAKLDETLQKTDALLAEKQKIEGDIHAFQEQSSKIKALEDELTEKSAALDELMGEKKKWDEEFSSALSQKARIEELEKRAAEKEAALDALTAKQKALASSVWALLKEESQKNDAAAAGDENDPGLSLEPEIIEAQLQTLLEGYQTRGEVLEKELNSAIEKIAALEKSLKETQDNARETAEKTEKMIRSQQDTILSKETELNQSAESIKNFQTQIGEYQQRIDGLQKDLEKLREFEAKFKSSEQSVLDASKKQQEELAQARREIETMMKASSATERQYGKRLHALKKRLIAYHRHWTRMISAGQTEEELPGMEPAEKAAALKEAKRMKEERDAVSKRLEDLKQEYSNFMLVVKDQLDERDRELVRLRRLSADSPAQTASAESSEKSEREASENLSQGLTQDLENLKQQLEAAQKEISMLRSVNEKAASVNETSVPAASVDASLIQSLEEQIQTLQKQRKADQANFFYNLGVIYTENKLYKEAVDIYERALEVNPQDAWVHHHLGILYEEVMLDPDRALVHYKEFVRLNPDEESVREVSDWIAKGGKPDDRSTWTRAKSARKAFRHLLLTTST